MAEPAIVTVANPAAGAGWSTMVPTGKRWRVWGGSCQIVTTATAGNRDPYLLFKNGTTVVWAAGKDGAWQDPTPSRFIPPSATRTLVFYEACADLNESAYDGIYFPIASKAIWLPAGTVVSLGVQNLAVGDQLSNIRLLVEEVASDAGTEDSTGVGEIVTFASPAVGTSFSTTVPAGEAWRIWGGSCHVTASALSTEPTPCLVLRHGTTHIYVSSNGNDYTASANQTVVYNNETVSLCKGTPIVTVAGEAWDIHANPPGLIYNPMGVRPVWLPAGTTIHYFMQAMHAADQVSEVGMLVERVAAADVTEGLGTIQTVSTPAAGQGFTATVPTGKRWRVWGGSARIVCSAVAGSRFPSITYETAGGQPLWFGAQASHANEINSDHYVTYYDAEVLLTDLYVDKYLPVPLRAIWLPSGSKIVGRWFGIQAGDQVSEIGFLVEELDE